jgi:alpha-L-rhamnosidase
MCARSLAKSFAVLCILSATTQAQWSANWIWQSVDGPQNTWMCFRKTISLPSAPASAPTRIAADSKYWLWINGQLAVFEGGLKRDLPSGTYFDTLDLAKYLTSGSNTIAVLVWYWGKEGFSHTSSGKGGLLFEGDFGGVSVRSDATWKTRVHAGYQNSTSGGQPNFRLSEFNVRFNAQSSAMDNWQQASYVDTDWPMAIAKGIPPAAPWNTMIARPFPQWKNSGLKEYSNASAFPATSTGGVVEGKLPGNIRVSGYLKIRSSTAGQVINIQTDQYSGWADFGSGPSIRAEYITREGSQEFETLVWMSGTTVRYSIPAGVTIEALHYRELGYPSEFAGQFTSSDPFYTKLWRMAGNTLYLNMADNFSDCPERERALWWGDVVNQLGETFYTLDTNANGLIRKSIRTLIAWQRSNNTLFAPPTPTWNQELPLQMLASVGWYGFWNYYWNTGDTATLRAAYPAVRKYLSVWKTDANGLVQHRDGEWNWGDWGTNIDYPVLDNAWYYLALKAAIPMAVLSGAAADTAGYRNLMKGIEASFTSTFWNAGSQHFRSSSLSTPDDRANAMAVVAGFAKPQHYPGIRTVMQQRTFASPYMEKYVLEALVLMGSDSLALARMKTRYTEMVNGPYPTLWELWTGLKEGTINHGWNAPNTILSQYIAGLSPTAPGWEEYHILPQMGNLTAVSQTAATVKGIISVSDSLYADRFVMRLQSPLGTKAHIGIPKKRAWKSILVNGRLIWNDGVFATGITGVTGVGADSLYLRFTIQPGEWLFEARLTPSTSLEGLSPFTPERGKFLIQETALGLEILGNGRQNWTVQLFDPHGKAKSNLFHTTSGRVTVPRHLVPTGIYFVQILSDKESLIRKGIRMHGSNASPRMQGAQP